jgi:hypothetical protein
MFFAKYHKQWKPVLISFSTGYVQTDSFVYIKEYYQMNASLCFFLPVVLTWLITILFKKR